MWLQKTEHYSMKTHLLFGAVMMVSVFCMYLFFSHIIQDILKSMPFFGYSVISVIVIGFLYYSYKVILFKNIRHDYLYEARDKAESFFNILQIFIAVVATISILMNVFNILQMIKNNMIAQDTALSMDYNILTQPFYMIIISLIAISILFVFSLRIKEILSQIYDMYHQSVSHKPLENAFNTHSLSHNGAFMSHNISDTPPVSDAQSHKDETVPFTLPHYDYGFFYKKLFEMNDNILHLKRQIIVAGNDNTTEVHVHRLWEDKIYPFLQTLSDRIKTLEDKFQNDIPQTSLAKTAEMPVDKSADKIDDTVQSEEITLKTFPLDSLVDDIPDVLHDEKTTIEKPRTISDDFIQEMTNKMITQMQNGLMGNVSPIVLESITTEAPKDKHSASIPDTLPQDDTEEVFVLGSDNLISDINIDISDEEETFIMPHNHQTGTGQKNRDTEFTNKEKTLEELRGLLESKMQQFYKNEFNTL